GRHDDARGAAVDVRRRHERKPELGAERPPCRVHVDALGQIADLHDFTDRTGFEADHEGWQQHAAGLVEVETDTKDAMGKKDTKATAVTTARRTRFRRAINLSLCVVLISVAACHKEPGPVARPMPPPPPSSPTGRPPSPPEPVNEPTIVPPEPVRDETIASASLDDLNRNSLLKPVMFELDSSQLSGAAQKTLDENAAVLKKYPTWAVTIEGHCDERGTAEYNLALGERRA